MTSTPTQISPATDIGEALVPYFEELKAKTGILFAAHLIGNIHELVEARIKAERGQTIKECADQAELFLTGSSRTLLSAPVSYTIGLGVKAAILALLTNKGERR